MSGMDLGGTGHQKLTSNVFSINSGRNEKGFIQGNKKEQAATVKRKTKEPEPPPEDDSKQALKRVIEKFAKNNSMTLQELQTLYRPLNHHDGKTISLGPSLSKKTVANTNPEQEVLIIDA
ncbi:MAG: hypothetical protein MK033_09505 [Candidatus Caenarcaniphilales bacterium]|nr:hypothetical protein [Candidatus Caenarcaniphilales bacterium]